MAVGMVGGEIAAGEHFKGLGAEPEFFEHAFVVGAGEERDANFEENLAGVAGGVTLAKGFAADTISAASALFEDGGIPGQIVVDNMAAVAVEVYALLSHLSTYKHLGQEGRVEAGEDAVAGGDHVAAASFDEGDELLVAQPGGLVKGAPGRTGVRDVTAGGFKVFEENSNALRHAFVLVG